MAKYKSTDYLQKVFVQIDFSSVIMIFPPLWDTGAVFHIREEKWPILTFRKDFINKLLKYMKFPFAATWQKSFRQ